MGMWTNRLIDKLKEARAEGLSYEQIGVRLRLSKNACLSAARRYGIAPPPPSAAKPRKKPECPPVPSHSANRSKVSAPEKVIAAAFPIGSPVPLNPVPSPTPPICQEAKAFVGPLDGCAWPMSIPGRRGFRACGEPAVLKKPYCEQHCRVAYVKVPPKQREAW